MAPGRVLLVVATVVAFALTVRSVLGAPLPIWLSLSAFAGYGSVIALGVRHPSWEMFAEVVWRGPEEAQGAALTFEIVSPAAVRAVLAVLDAAGIASAFFVTGDKAALDPELVQEIASRGHLVGVLGERGDHPLSLRGIARIRADLARSVDQIAAIAGVRPRFYRPSSGQTNARTARVATDLKLMVIGWTADIAPQRGSAPDDDQRLEGDLDNGAIVLLRNAAEDDHAVSQSAAVDVKRVLAAMKRKGISVVRLDSWWDAPLPSDARDVAREENVACDKEDG